MAGADRPEQPDRDCSATPLLLELTPPALPGERYQQQHLGHERERARPTTRRSTAASPAAGWRQQAVPAARSRRQRQAPLPSETRSPLHAGHRRPPANPERRLGRAAERNRVRLLASWTSKERRPMANGTAQPRTFSRGSTVLDYWLAHAEGLTVQPLGARVEEVVVRPPVGRAEALIVRSRMTRRRRKIPAASIAAVEPSAGNLLLDADAAGNGMHLPRPSPERIAAARAGAQRSGRYARTHVTDAARATGTGTLGAYAWARPKAASAGTKTALGFAWLAPRVAHGARVAATIAVRTTLGAYAWARSASSERGHEDRARPRVARAARRARRAGRCDDRRASDAGRRRARRLLRRDRGARDRGGRARRPHTPCSSAGSGRRRRQSAPAMRPSASVGTIVSKR